MELCDAHARRPDASWLVLAGKCPCAEQALHDETRHRAKKLFECAVPVLLAGEALQDADLRRKLAKSEFQASKALKQPYLTLGVYTHTHIYIQSPRGTHTYTHIHHLHILLLPSSEMYAHAFDAGLSRGYFRANQSKRLRVALHTGRAQG